MSAAKHTPGPWDVDMGEVYAVRDSDGGRIAIMTNLRGRHGMAGRRDGDEVAANTLLTAAAPELLEACQMFAAYQKAVESDDPDARPLEKYCLAMDAARAAIAKATGSK